MSAAGSAEKMGSIVPDNALDFPPTTERSSGGKPKHVGQKYRVFVTYRSGK